MAVGNAGKIGQQAVRLIAKGYTKVTLKSHLNGFLSNVFLPFLSAWEVEIRFTISSKA